MGAALTLNRGPPVLWSAGFFALGALLVSFFALFPPLGTLLLIVSLLWLFLRPRWLCACVTLVVAGALWSSAAQRASPSRCLPGLADGASVRWDGYFLSDLVDGRGKFVAVGGPGLSQGCRPHVRLYLLQPDRVDSAQIVGGVGVQAVGRWVKAAPGRRGAAGYLSITALRRTELDVPLGTRVSVGLRRRVRSVFQRRLGNWAPLAAALTLADRSELDSEVQEAFIRTGTAHLLSISGFHVGIVAWILGGLMVASGSGPLRRALGVVTGVWLYVALLGFPSAAVRAATMATVFFVARAWQRPTQTLGCLGAAALLMLALDPSVASGAGFQLTVAGTAGILVLGRWVRTHMEDVGPQTWKPLSRLRLALASAVASGVGATVFTTPLLALHFHEVSLLSLPATLVVGPAVAMAVPGIVLLTVLDLLGIPGGVVVAWFVQGLLMSLEGIVMTLGRVEWASVYVGPSEGAIMAIGLVIGVSVLRAPWRVRPLVRVVSCLAFAWAALLVGRSVKAVVGLGKVQITAIDVGQGDAVALKTPRGRWVLFDAGPKGMRVDAGLSAVIPALRARGAGRIDLVVLSHPDEDHAGGLASVLGAFDIGRVVGPGMTIGQMGHLAGLAVAQTKDIPWTKVEAGDAWTLDGVRFRVLAPTPNPSPGASPNDRSVVVHVRYGKFDALFMGDASAEIEADVLVELCRIGVCRDGLDVLKVGHHGSSTSSSEAFVAALRPEVSLISVGRRNRYGHPSERVLSRLLRGQARVYRTDRQGTVDLYADAMGTVRVVR